MMVATASHYLTPPQLAQRWQVKISKIYAWINSGELVAANMSTSR